MGMAATTLADRALVRLSGEDVRGFLQGLVTSDVAGQLPVWTGLLTPQGKCLFDFIVWPDGEDLLLDCEAEAADDLARRLTIYRLRRPIRIERDEAHVVQWSADGEEGVLDPRLPALGRRWLQSCAPAEGEAQAQGADSGLLPSQEQSKWLEHRLRLGVCEGRAELGDLLWLECNAAELNGVSFTKGCFVGQENTARMNWRQKVNRRLVVCSGTGGERSRIDYPELGLSVVHARVDAIPSDAIIPDWLSAALAQPTTA
jgi:folate-binding protein YgfZ